MRISLTPSATPLLIREANHNLKRRGLARLAISLDGPNAEVHDAFRRVPGSYNWTLSAVRWAHKIDLPVQINTTTRHNLKYLDPMFTLLEGLDIVVGSVFSGPDWARLGDRPDLSLRIRTGLREALPDFTPGVLRHQQHGSTGLPPVPGRSKA